MSSWIVPIVVALIGGPLMILFARFDKRNTEQHGENMKILQRVETKVDKVDDRLSGHIDWHLDRDNK
jgi:uncharacterized membrane-anchored protein YhcB (DUF1043 family)